MTAAVRPAALALLWLAAPLAAAPAPAPNAPAALPFPAKAPVVVQVNGVERTQERLAALLTAAVPDDAPRLTKQMRAGVARLLDGRKLTAVPKDGRVFLVVHDLTALGDGEKPVSVLVPVTDAKAFRDTLLTADERKSFEKGSGGVGSFKTTARGDEDTVYAVELPGYVALTPDKATAEAYAGKFERATAAGLGGESAAAFLGGDVSLYVNMASINDLYGMQIRTFKQLIDFGFMQAQGGGMTPGLNKKQMEAIKAAMKGMFQGVEDADALAVAAEFRPAGLNLRAAADFADGTDTAKFLAGEEPTALEGLARLPAGQMQYTGSRFGRKFAAVARGLNAEFAAADDDEKTAEAVDKLAADLAAAGPQAEFDAASLPDAALRVTTYTDPAKAVAALTRVYKALGEGAAVMNVRLKDKPKLTEAAVKHRGFALTEVRLAFDFDATVKDLPDGVKELTLGSIKRLVGEKTTVWYGTDGRAVVQVRAKDATAATALLDAYLDGKAGVGATAAFAATRSNLPASATMVGLTDVPKLFGMLGEYFKMMGAMPGLPAALPELKKVDGDPAYLGVALTLKPGSVRGDLFVPAAGVRLGRKALAPLIQTVD